jgi:hypothetical protein
MYFTSCRFFFNTGGKIHLQKKIAWGNLKKKNLQGNKTKLAYFAGDKNLFTKNFNIDSIL